MLVLRLKSVEKSHDRSQGNSMTPARRSGLEMKFCSKKKCRLPGSFCHMNNPISHDDPTILEVRFSSLENTDLGSQPCGQGSMWPCVCPGKCTRVFWQISPVNKSRNLPRGQGSWIHGLHGEDWPWDVCLWKGWCHTSGKKGQMQGRPESRVRWDRGVRLPGFESWLQYL